MRGENASIMLSYKARYGHKIEIEVIKYTNSMLQSLILCKYQNHWFTYELRYFSAFVSMAVNKNFVHSSSKRYQDVA
jgi:hypothetical protein